MHRAIWNGAIIAESPDVEVVDGYTYFPKDAVDADRLEPSDQHTFCPWKGTASYYDIVMDGAVNEAAAWYYPDPSRRAAPLVGGRIGFWRGVEIEVDHDDRGHQRHGLFARLAARRRAS